MAVKVMAKVAEGISPKDLKGLVDQGKESVGSGVVVMIAVSDDGKVGVVVGVTDDLTDRFSAVDLVKLAAEKLGGRGGGGRPDMAQAGGKDADKANDAIAAIEAAIAAGISQSFPTLFEEKGHDRWSCPLFV